MEALRQKLSIKGTQEDTHFRASNPLSTRPSRGHGKVSQQCAFGLCLGLESVITSSVRLDMPFTFRMT
ncbi:hypothetical protein N7516_005679 [Penicillium verrucosum]|uniref:uncharacterized protein n=1 Tax=Penicillium verrucosum TaxID=60171 RepID=UPI002544D704|nr:uncharacterized protein N7516_005679 [Penicillium verrucosum]KAJ5931190.1 hypothetical protein N7516_005679 [Penicillium verrucosum]